MSASDIAWSFGLLAILLLALVLFARRRRRTRDFHESAAFKAELPAWVRQLEAIVACALVCAGMLAVTWLFMRVARAPSGPGGVYFAIGAGLVAVPFGFLAANGLSWLLPPVRAANQRAMAGLKVSFWSMNRGLLYFGAASAPAGVVLLAMAAAAPWR